MNNKLTKIAFLGGVLTILTMAFSGATMATETNICSFIDHVTLTRALKNALPAGAGGEATIPGIELPDTNGGLDLPMWATVVDEHGRVCEVTFSGLNHRAQWQASRVISMQKAYTTNSLTVNGAPGIWSTALLFTPTQPGQFLWGLHQSNPVDPTEVYDDPADWGTENDPMEDEIPGGVNTFGGGVSLWLGGNAVGGLGVSGDTSCADHNIALRVRDNLVALTALTDNPAGPYADNIIYDIEDSVSASGLGHPACPGGNEEAVNTAITGIKHPDHDAWPGVEGDDDDDD